MNLERGGSPEMVKIPDASMERTPEELVAWTLDFINSNLSLLGRTERVQLAVEVYSHLIGGGEVLGSDDTQDLGLDLEKIQGKLREFFNSYIRPLITGERKDSGRLPRLASKLKDHRSFLVFNGILNYGEVWEGNIEDRIMEKFEFLIRRAIPLPVAAFRKCEGCDNFFLPTGKRVRKSRRFCTPQCNMRYHARKRRAADPEGYKAKQREIMKKRYREKQSEKFPKAKIGRDRKE